MTIGEMFEEQEAQAKTRSDKVTWMQIRNQYDRLTEAQREMAAKGIARHAKACSKTGLPIDEYAVREIVGDAKADRAVWSEDDFKTGHPAEAM